MSIFIVFIFFFKQKTAYEIGTGDWSSDVCSSDLVHARKGGFESKIEFIIIGGEVQEVVIKEVKGRKDRKSVV